MDVVLFVLGVPKVGLAVGPFTALEMSEDAFLRVVVNALVPSAGENHLPDDHLDVIQFLSIEVAVRSGVQNDVYVFEVAKVRDTFKGISASETVEFPDAEDIESISFGEGSDFL